MTKQCEPWWTVLPELDAVGCSIGLGILAVFDVWLAWFFLHFVLGWWQ